jgi:hypothetical protein
MEFIQPDLFKGSDMLAEQAAITKNEMLSRISQSRALMFASHFPFPGLGYVSKEEDVYSWTPL